MFEGVLSSLQKELQELLTFVNDRKRLLLITGAGCSTGSGIGDYRDDQGLWKISSPIQHQDFLRSETARKRYWMRSQLGYPSFRNARPNPAHYCLARLDSNANMVGLITQNVDRLHQKAGQRDVIDLHGRLDEVICLDCNAVTPRDQIQNWLESKNAFVNDFDFELRPDGDASLESDDFSFFKVPDCPKCGGFIKPNVVFFGGAVPKNITEECLNRVMSSDGVLIIGTSMMAFSGFRIVRVAHERGLPIASLNLGITRADEMVTLNIKADCVEVLNALDQKLA